MWEFGALNIDPTGNYSFSHLTICHTVSNFVVFGAFVSLSAWSKLVLEPLSSVFSAAGCAIRSGTREVEMPALKEMKEFDTVDHFAVPVSDVKNTVEWYLQNFNCKVAYQDDTWALLEFANIRLAFVLPQQHPPHFALLRDPAAFGEPKTHRDGTRSVYLNDPSGNSVEVLALK